MALHFAEQEGAEIGASPARIEARGGYTLDDPIRQRLAARYEAKEMNPAQPMTHPELEKGTLTPPETPAPRPVPTPPPSSGVPPKETPQIPPRPVPTSTPNPQPAPTPPFTPTSTPYPQRVTYRTSGTIPKVLHEEYALLTSIGFPIPSSAHIEMGTWKARFIGWIVSRLDAPPIAVTIGHTIYIPNPNIYQELPANSRAALLAHELTHVKQWDDRGLGGFLKEYFKEYLRTRLQQIDTHDLLQGISLERDAIRVEHEVYEKLEKMNK